MSLFLVFVLIFACRVASPVSMKSSLTQDNEDADRPGLTSSANAEDEVFVHSKSQKRVCE